MSQLKPDSEGFIPVQSGQLYYRVFGEGASTLVWMHGLPLNGNQWSAQVRHFSKTYRNVTFDLRGYGKTSGIPPGTESVSDLYVQDLEALFEHLKIQDPVLIAFASGGHGALRFAAKRPGVLSKLVVLNASPRFRQGEDWPWGFDDSTLAGFIDYLENRDYADVIDSLLERALVELDTSDRMVLRGRFQTMASSTSKETLAGFFCNIANDDDRELMKKINVPTLILTSSLGKEVPPDVGLFLRKEIPQSHLIEIPGVDHFFFATAPKLVNALIEQFLSPKSALEEQ
jgi:non-heme chloroperoxidase